MSDTIQGETSVDGLARFLPLALVVLGVLALWGGLRAPFLYDDLGSIVRNGSIAEVSDVGAVLSPPKDETVSGRPLLNLSFALDRARVGLDPRGYHHTNLAIHLAATLLLFGLVRRTLARSSGTLRSAAPWLAALVAGLWMLHPLQTESVTYVVQRAESLVGLFYLATLYAAARSFEAESSGRWTALAFVACLCGMATKEVMVTAPLVVLLYDRAFVSSSFRAALRAHGRLYASLASTWLLLGALVAQAPRSSSAGFGFAKVSPFEYLITQSGVLLHYLRLTVWPAPLVFHYDWPVARGAGEVWWQLVLVVALLIAACVAMVRRPSLGFAGLACFLVLAPTSTVVPILTEIAAEHRMYLPLAGLLALAVVGAFVALQRVGLERRVGVVLGLIALAGCAWGSIRRNQDYESVVTLWASVVAVEPENGLAHDSLGLALREAGRLAEARAHGETAVRLRPLAPDFRLNLATTLLDLGEPAAAEMELREALRLREDDALTHNALGVALAQAGRGAEARASFERALALDPQVVGARENLAAVSSGAPIATPAANELGARIEDALRAGRGHEAIALLRESIEAAYDRDHAQTLARLLATHPDAALRDGDEALRLAERLDQESATPDPVVLDTLAAAYAEVGRFEDALHAAERALAAPLRPELAPLADGIRRRMELYRRGEPFHLPGG